MSRRRWTCERAAGSMDVTERLRRLTPAEAAEWHAASEEGDRQRGKTSGRENRERGEQYSVRDEGAHASLSEEVILAN